MVGDKTIPLPQGYEDNLDMAVEKVEDYHPKAGTSEGLTPMDNPATERDDRDYVEATVTDPGF